MVDSFGRFDGGVKYHSRRDLRDALVEHSYYIVTHIALRSFLALYPFRCCCCCYYGRSFVPNESNTCDDESVIVVVVVVVVVPMVPGAWWPTSASLPSRIGEWQSHCPVRNATIPGVMPNSKYHPVVVVERNESLPWPVRHGHLREGSWRYIQSWCWWWYNGRDDAIGYSASCSDWRVPQGCVLDPKGRVRRW